MTRLTSDLVAHVMHHTQLYSGESGDEGLHPRHEVRALEDSQAVLADRLTDVDKRLDRMESLLLEIHRLLADDARPGDES